MDGRTDIDLAELTKRLTERRDELLRLASTTEQGPVELDPSRIGRLSRMDAMQQQGNGERDWSAADIGSQPCGCGAKAHCRR